MLAPLLLFAGAALWGARPTALAAGGLLLVRGAAEGARPARGRGATLFVASVGGLLAAGAWALRSERLLRGLPAVTSAAVLLVFAASLRGTPLVERFARLAKPALSPAELRYCRRVTEVWVAFLAANTLLIAALAVFASARAWALYAGVVSYALMGLLGVAEYIVRKARFREYSSRLPDRLLARVFPPRPPSV